MMRTLIVLATLLVVTPAYAINRGPFLVDRFDDPDPSTVLCNPSTANNCSLRKAIEMATSTLFPAFDATITLPSGTYTLNSTVTVAKDITLIGNHAIIKGELEVTGGVVVLNDVHLQKTLSTSGAVTLTLNDAEISGTALALKWTATSGGLTMNGGFVHDNEAAIFAEDGAAAVSFNRTVFARNKGVAITSGASATTFNQATLFESSLRVTKTNALLFFTTVVSSALETVGDATLTFHNSIVPKCTGKAISLGFNAIASLDGCDIDLKSGDMKEDIAFASTDPRALLPACESAAIDQACKDCAPVSDARGALRNDGTPDVGAYEVEQAALSSTSEAPASVTLGSAFVVSYSLDNDGTTDAADVAVKVTVPAGLSVVSQPASCSGSSPMICTRGTLAADASFSLAFNVTAEAVGTHVIKLEPITSTCAPVSSRFATVFVPAPPAPQPGTEPEPEPVTEMQPAPTPVTTTTTTASLPTTTTATATPAPAGETAAPAFNESSRPAPPELVMTPKANAGCSATGTADISLLLAAMALLARKLLLSRITKGAANETGNWGDSADDCVRQRAQ